MSKFVADLHLHSFYSRATSRDLNFDTLATWAKLKGIQLLASADFTHPSWWRETKEKLKESKSSGLYEYNSCHFILGTEISCIYSQGGRQRRIHCLLFFPEKRDAEEFNREAGRYGSLTADGRPILGISARELLSIALSVNEKAILIPAHAWTPWFSLYGSNSGFDSLEECFGDISKYIYAVETGLSSDPAMNWRIVELDSRSIVSFSDAHSTPKLGREATVFETDFSYEGLFEALKSRAPLLTDQQFDVAVKSAPKDALRSQRGKRESLPTTRSNNEAGVPLTAHRLGRLAAANSVSKVAFTIEFFPEEGKYHFTGHRSCNIRHSPDETAKLGIICPKCKKKLTIGVMHRVEELASRERPQGFSPPDRPPYKMLVPLQEIIAESLGSPATSERVRSEYLKICKHFGSEFAVLLKAPVEEIQKVAHPKIAQGVEKVRNKDIIIEPGFDGVYGKVKIWPVEEKSLKEKKQAGSSLLAEGQTRLPGF